MLIIFEDECLDALSPLIEYRPTFFFKIGTLNLFEYLSFLFPKKKIVLFSERKLIAEKYELSFNHKTIFKKKALFLNGRLLPEAKTMISVKKILELKEELALFNDDELILFKSNSVDFKIKFQNILEKANACAFKSNLGYELKMLENVFQLPKINASLLPEHLKIQVKKHLKIKTNVYSDEKIKLPKNVVLDTSKGSIFIAGNSKIEPWVYLKGPLWVGEKCLIKSHSQIESSYLGEQTKIGGEVMNALIYPYSNKSHHGFLGDSVIGSWVNIGAGATTSNLKNTYGNIKGHLLNSGKKIITQENKLGVIVGDFAKIAINTSMLTGKLIGIGASVIGTISDNVPAFKFYINEQKSTSWNLSSFLEMVKRMFHRRKKKLFSKEMHLITDLYQTKINHLKKSS